ncbi:MAG: amidohydrolase family protein [Polyangiaceae bacterium]|nr:amidohydrolase family protein [Polyangiaceae bacterium]
MASWLDAGNVPLPAIDDEEGAAMPASLPPVTDAHVHVFPDGVFEALWRWFEAYAWPIRYKLRAPEVVRFLLSRGVERVFALHYAHKPGMARALNSFVAELCASDPRIVGFATVLPGEPDAPKILEEAKTLGLRAVKLHCHVQSFAPDAPEALEVFGACQRLGLPVLVHAGREPRSPKYAVDPFSLCGADRVEAVLRAFPTLRVCVPHFGADEQSTYFELIERYDNLYLDTTMMMGGYFPFVPTARSLLARPERILYGTDFPSLPYAWDRELSRLAAFGLPEDALAQILSGSATSFLDG